MVCRNERTFLDQAIRSVLPFVDEVIVGDMHSTDGSAELARSLGARVFDIDPAPIAEMAREPLVSSATGEWILIVDPDEVMEPRLGRELRRIVESEACDVVELPFRTYMMGRPITGTGWATEHESHARLFRAGRATLPTSVHSSIASAASHRQTRVDQSRGVIHHFNYVSWEQFVEKMDRYTTLEATRELKANDRPRWSRLVWRIGGEIYHRGVKGRAWRDGWRGPVLVILMCCYRVLTFAKARQRLEGLDDDAVVTRYREIAEQAMRH
jgi:glycosyltransferase involved in cell wall biosynthesis